MATESITLVRQSGKTQTFIPQVSGVPRSLWLIKPDTHRTGVPLTCQFRPEHTAPFTPDRQQFVFSLNRSDNEARDRQAFQGYRDTINTRGKVRDNWNDILQEGDYTSMPTIEFNIGIRANVVSGVQVLSDGLSGIPKDVPVLQMDTIDINNPLPYGITYRTHPWLVHHEIIGLYEKRNPFIQMGGKAREPYRPCYTPLWSKGKMFIRMSELDEVPFGTLIPNPYEPAWGELLYHTFRLGE